MDELDDLVREVIEENPPEEQGIRSEWVEHVGWGRKENIYNLRGREHATEEFHLNHSTYPVDGHEIADHSLPRRLNFQAKSLRKILVSLSSTMIVLFVIIYACKCFKKKLCAVKPRKTEADTV